MRHLLAVRMANTRLYVEPPEQLRQLATVINTTRTPLLAGSEPALKRFPGGWRRILMKLRTLAGLAALAFTVACGGGSPAEEPAVEPAAPSSETVEETAGRCDAVGELQFICDVISPEDLAVVPDTEWVIASGNQEGGRIQLVSILRMSARVLFPASNNSSRLDSDTYPSCPGPIDPEEGDDFRAHGLYLKPGEGRVHTLYVVHHGFRESIEVFELDPGVSPPSLTWVGCAVTPEGTTLNAVVALPDGGFATTATRLEGEVTSAVLEWQTETGWARERGYPSQRPRDLRGREVALCSRVDRRALGPLVARADPRTNGHCGAGFPTRQCSHGPGWSDLRDRSHGLSAANRRVQRCQGEPRDVGV